MLDVVFAVFFAVVLVAFEAIYYERRFKRREAEGFVDARRNAYRLTLTGLWLTSGAAVWLWAVQRRPWHALGLVPPSDWRLQVGIGLAAVTVALVLRQNAVIRGRSPERLAASRPKLAGVDFFVPHSAREYRWFLGLSWTAGVCEELLYRGYLTWLVASYAGTAVAVVLVSVAFACAHAYQGPKGMARVGVTALVFSGIVLLGGWLVPAMIIHALVDIAGGYAGYAILRSPAPGGAAAEATPAWQAGTSL